MMTNSKEPPYCLRCGKTLPDDGPCTATRHPAAEAWQMFADGGGDAERVEIVAYTKALIDDKRGAAMIGEEVRQLLLEGKTVCVKAIEGK